jgi:hypothetical protein
MRTFTHHPAASLRARQISLAAAVLIASAGAVIAKDHRPDQANPSYGLYEHRSASVQGPQMHATWSGPLDPSGTLGREGLGESPFYPEGPGNFED